MNEDYFFIEDADDFIVQFENPEHFNEWLENAHAIYDFEEIEELKQLTLDHQLDNYYLVCKQFEYKYFDNVD